MWNAGLPNVRSAGFPVFQINARQAGHHDPEISELYSRLRDRLAAIPGVRQVSLADSSLITAGDGLPITVPAKPPLDDTRMKRSRRLHGTI